VTSVHGEDRKLRLFVADASGDNWTELTSGTTAAVRLAAPDLAQARRARRRLDCDAAVILDVTVAIGPDFRSARDFLPGDNGDTLQYAGTVDGLAGLVADIFIAEVADGVTLIPASPGLDVRKLADAARNRIAQRLPLAA
jgi:hypothetical protein